MTDHPEPGFPSWRYGPEGAAQIFLTAADVPAGWTDHPAKLDGTSPVPEVAANQCAQPERSTAAKRMKRRRLRAARRPIVIPT